MKSTSNAHLQISYKTYAYELNGHNQDQTNGCKMLNGLITPTIDITLEEGD